MTQPLFKTPMLRPTYDGECGSWFYAATGSDALPPSQYANTLYWTRCELCYGDLAWWYPAIRKHNATKVWVIAYQKPVSGASRFAVGHDQGMTYIRLGPYDELGFTPCMDNWLLWRKRLLRYLESRGGEAPVWILVDYEPSA